MSAFRYGENCRDSVPFRFAMPARSCQTRPKIRSGSSGSRQPFERVRERLPFSRFRILTTCPLGALQDQFRKARATDYTALIKDLQRLKPSAKGPSAKVLRLRRRFEEIVAIDFFTSPLRRKAEEALAQVEQIGAKPNLTERGSASKAKYQKRTWMTRPRPGIDRVSSAWLISRFIDRKAEVHLRYQPHLSPPCRSV